MTEEIKHPTHYLFHDSHGREHEVGEITDRMSFNRGNVIKYLARAPLKGSRLKDLRKALEYIGRLLKCPDGYVMPDEVFDLIKELADDRYKELDEDRLSDALEDFARYSLITGSKSDLELCISKIEFEIIETEEILKGMK